MKPHPLQLLRTALPTLRRDFSITTLALFGSAARGDVRPSSDIDILVTFDPSATVTLFTLARLQSRLEDLLGARVDLVEDHPRLRPAFRETIERDLLRVA